MLIEPRFFTEEARRHRSRQFCYLSPAQVTERLALIHSDQAPIATELAVWLESNWQDDAIRMLGRASVGNYLLALEQRHIEVAFG